ncbi:predicted protein [Nematostella vectensis]|uniref:Protein Churchill n=1 Tax=Nematostella vectensis TaxID=45351 RepID=A3EXK7_NEMVE|nr:churchill [Nematostella vectensis]EDO36771.1 predicted protein [Nematostella vectensis]|eukprot:XP_001628834.1 predicted protein [Nematostella vectensis]
MCRDCVKQQLPDRGNMCLDNGSYLWNFQGCKECGQKDPVKIVDRQTTEDEDGEETITYKHECVHCGHVVAEHEFTFRVGDSQDYSMSCLLCGEGTDQRNIFPENQYRQNGVA